MASLKTGNGEMKTMTYLLTGLVAATLLGVGSVVVLGPGSQMEHTWIEPLFWAFIGAGALTSLVKGGRRKQAGYLVPADQRT